MSKYYFYDSKIKVFTKIAIYFLIIIAINMFFITPFNPVKANSYFKESISYLKNQEDKTIEPKQKRVLAFYYSWYRLYETSNDKKHWNKIDDKKKEISDSAHYPKGGAYDSTNPEIIERHMKQAKEAGIDTFVVSWWGINSYETKEVFPLILDKAEKYDLTVTLYYEKNERNSSEARIEQGLKDLKFIYQEYANHPAFLKVNGKPVIFIYKRAIHQMKWKEWAVIINRFEKETNNDFAFIVDYQNSIASTIFDGLHTYNLTSVAQDKSLNKIKNNLENRYKEINNMAAKNNIISTLTVIPGFDSRKIGGDTHIPRRKGKLYSAMWEKAMEINPNWVVVTSWNEWHEGTEIEPSLEFGDKYLKLTKKYARIFKHLPEKNISYKEESNNNLPKKKNYIERKYNDKEIALMANSQTSLIGNDLNNTILNLIKLGLDFEVVTYREIVENSFTKNNYDILIYASGEDYTRSIKENGDVDQALRNYIKSGGHLIAAPSGPFPFYSNQFGNRVNKANEIGFSIFFPKEFEEANEPYFKYSNSAKEILDNVDDKKITYSEEFRLRPSQNKDKNNAKYYSILKLYDKKGEYYGDGAAYINYKRGYLDSNTESGSTMYIWYGLLNTDKSIEVLYNSFKFLAKKENY